MISSAYRFIYIHVPKTGGNSIQDALLPYSDDRKVCVSHLQDGVDRFEIRGELTPSKHAAISHYLQALGPDLGGHRVVVSLRHPFDRALSFYFSPHSRLQTQPDGRVVTLKPVWRREAFLKLCAQITPAARFLSADSAGQVVRPHHVILYERLAKDFADTAKALGLPAVPAELAHLNRSADTAGLKAEVAADARLRAQVERMFRADMQLMAFAERATG